MTIETRSEHGCFGGRQGFYSHASAETGTRMNFSVFVPDLARREPVPALYYLAGLTCTEETFMIKAGAQRRAAELGLALVTCDTSPRGLGYPGESDSWDFGLGAGFYIDATQAPWSRGYRMGSYVDRELPALVEAHFRVRPDRRGIFGHSMGGHGALVTALRNPSRWNSVSAFAPIGNPMNVPWGRKAFGHFLGPDTEVWKGWDACELMRQRRYPGTILVDQGTADAFLERELRPDVLEATARECGQALTMHRRAGYDHGYYFIQTYVADHLAHHHRILEGLG